MKNENEKRKFRSYYFIFEDHDMMIRFIQLYGDLFMTYEWSSNTYSEQYAGLVKVRAEAGVIPKIKKDLGNMLRTKYSRYYVRRVA